MTKVKFGARPFPQVFTLMSELGQLSLLLADDQPDVLKALRLLFKREGMDTQAVASPAAVLDEVQHRHYDLLLIDLNYSRDTTSGNEGLDLLSKIRMLSDSPPVIVMTAWGSVELAVEAMRRGAKDFIEKPWANERLLTVVRTQVEMSRAVRRAAKAQAELQFLRQQGQVAMIAESRAMQGIIELLERVCASDANVLITGDNGTGKEVVARFIHKKSPRSAEPLVTVDAASLAEHVFESELFGHVKGAFTDARTDRAGRIELADGGTLFLDEIANVPLKLQAKLLRVVESGEFEPVGASTVRRADVRWIAATNADLHAEIALGRFREDLFFRLNTVEIHLPPLRDRREDIPLLAQHFLREQSVHYRKKVAGFTPQALDAMVSYAWPGNIRQLKHVVERAVLMARDEFIAPSDLGLNPTRTGPERLEDLPLEDVERVLIEKAMARHHCNVSQAAATLGLSRTALYRRLEKYGIGPAGRVEEDHIEG